MSTERPLKDLIRELRSRAKLTQIELAVALGKSYSTIQKYEGIDVPPPASELAKLALLARERGFGDLAVQFKVAALKDVPAEIIELIREPDSEREPKASNQSPENRRKTRRA